jgi:cell division protein ZapA
MVRSAVEVNVGGQLYRLVASAGEQTLRRYAGVVNERLRDLSGTGPTHPQAMLLVAMALAHDLEQERQRNVELRQQAESMLRGLLERVNAALDGADGVDENVESLPELPAG